MKYILVAILLAICITSCDRTNCLNHQRVFEQYTPKDKEYVTELVKRLRQLNPKRLDYDIGGYEEINDIPYMIVNITGSGLCATCFMDIKDADRMAQFKSVKGGGYRGAGLIGLQYHIDSSGGEYRFIFDDVSWIFD